MNADSVDPLEKYPFAKSEKVIITPILSAIIEKDYAKLKKLLELKNKQRSCETIPCFTPLHLTAEIGDHEAAEILIQHGADANAQYISQRPIELISTDKNETSVTNVITPLFIAMMFYNYDTILVLLRAGARMDNLNQNARRKFLWLTLNGGQEVLFKLILPHVDRLSEPHKLGSYLVHTAVLHRLHTHLQLLLQYGADPNVKDSDGNVPLMLAAIKENDVALDMLCRFGADLEAVNNKGHTTLYAIAEYGFELTLRFNSVNSFFIFSNIKKSSEIFRTLLCFGANPNTCDNEGLTVFECAVGVNKLIPISSRSHMYVSDLNEDLVEWLLMYGAEWKSTKIDFFKEKRSRTGTIIVEYNVKKKLAGLKYQDDVLNEGNDLLKKDFREKCIAELEKMKTQHLFKNMTMYGFLHCFSKRSLVSILNREEVKKIYEQALYITEFPIYKNLLERNFKEGKMYRSIYDSAYDDLNSLCNYRLPNIVLDKIIDHINKKDMDNVKKAINKKVLYK